MLDITSEKMSRVLIWETYCNIHEKSIIVYTIVQRKKEGNDMFRIKIMHVESFLLAYAGCYITA